MRYIYMLLLVLVNIGTTSAQIINAYAKITAVTGSSVLTLSNVNQTNHTFNVNERVIVMQMQDNVIGTNTTNASTFGDLSSIANAGKYEIKTIAARTPTSGTPTSLTLTSTLGNTYNTGANSSVQLISYRYLGNNFTSTANITGLAWDGNVGGVIGIEVNNIFTLNHQISADGIGFAGGARSADADETCSTTFYIGNDGNKGYKGEGIYKNTNANFNNGRAKIINGGGGGSQNNAGGGGGSNYSSGGSGGLGWQCNTSNSGYGLGGVTLSTSISGSRVFMGGGGGGGQMNNTAGTAGANGGGIILLKANTLVTNTVCSSPIRISADGLTAANSGNDGSGGGGGGGSIVLQVSTFSVSSSCPLTNSSSGGAGGNVTDPGSHGGGGGGGQGVVIYSILQPTANITTSVTNGAAGTDSSGGNTSATTGSTSSGTGVVASGSSPLPIILASFYAEKENSRVKLVWTTASEKNNALFTIEKSETGFEFTEVGSVKGAINSEAHLNYQMYDNTPYSGTSYYRLKQTDVSGDFKYSPLLSMNFEESVNFSIYPNPAESAQPVTLTLDKNLAGKTIGLGIYDLTGKELLYKTIVISTPKENQFNLCDFHLEKGVYVIKVVNGYSSSFKKLVVK